MTHKQRKALARRKAIAKARNIRNNNLKANPLAKLGGGAMVYRLWNI